MTLNVFVSLAIEPGVSAESVLRDLEEFLQQQIVYDYDPYEVEVEIQDVDEYDA